MVKQPNTASMSTALFLAVGTPVSKMVPPASTIFRVEPLSNDQLYDFLLDKIPTPQPITVAAASETNAASTIHQPGRLLDYLLDTQGRVPLPDLKAELPHQEQQMTLTLIVDQSVNRDAAQSLLRSVAQQLEHQPEMY
jgi:hypothetical protein